MQTQRTLEIVEQVGVLRPRDLNAYGIPREHLRRLHARGPGYAAWAMACMVLPNADLTEHHTLTEACKRVPQGSSACFQPCAFTS